MNTNWFNLIMEAHKLNAITMWKLFPEKDEELPRFWRLYRKSSERLVRRLHAARQEWEEATIHRNNRTSSTPILAELPLVAAEVA